MDAPPAAPWRAVWVAWALLVVVEIGIALVIDALVGWGAGTTCSNTPTAHNRTDGLRDLGIAAGVLALPWVLWMLPGRRLGRLVLGLLLSLSPLALMALTHLDVASWRGD